MDKYSFISDLMKNKSLTHSQKERICQLVAKEIKNDESKDSEILRRIREIEKKLNENGGITKIEGLKEYINPLKQYNALLAYNQNPILKTTCHDVNDYYLNLLINKSNETENYDFQTHLNLIFGEFEKISNSKEYGFTNKMYTLINNYLKGKSTWSSQNINISWNDGFLKKWSKNNRGMVPNPSNELIENNGNAECFLEKEFVSKFTGKTISTFTDLVLFFKSLWHIKDENPLSNIIERNNKSLNYKSWADIKFHNFSETLNLYTDVDKLIQAYNKIMNLIRKHSDNERTKIILSFYHQNNKKIFSIHQSDTFWKKSIVDTKEKPFGRDMEPIINKLINGLCDLHLRAKFEDGKCAELNLWDGKPIESKPLDDFNGVEYLLILKK